LLTNKFVNIDLKLIIINNYINKTNIRLPN